MCGGVNFNLASNELTLEVRAAVVGLLAEAFGVLRAVVAVRRGWRMRRCVNAAAVVCLQPLEYPSLSKPAE